MRLPGIPETILSINESFMSSTIKEVAARAKVSIATVSRALNNDVRVTEETKQRIMQIVHELNYKPNVLARNFVKQKSNLIGLILPEISDEFFTEVIKGVDEILYSNGFFTIVTSSHKYESLDDEIVTFINNGLISGLILLTPDLKPKLESILLESKQPVVLINSSTKLKKFDRIILDNYEGSFEMVKYLVQTKKYSHLAHITGPLNNDDAEQRKKGFLDACKNFGVKYSIEAGDFTRESGANGCKNLMIGKNKPQVIFTGNDMMAIGCYEYLHQNKMRIPDDVGIAGFDDIFVSQYLSPALTTVRIQIEEIGRNAAEILVKRIKNEIKSSSVTFKASSELIIRQSC